MPPHWKVGTSPVLDQTTTTIITAGEAMTELNPVVLFTASMVMVSRSCIARISIITMQHRENNDDDVEVHYPIDGSADRAGAQGAIPTCQNIVGKSLTPPVFLACFGRPLCRRPH